MISAIFRHLLSLGVYTLIFVPLLTVSPIFSLATPFIFWLHPSGYNYLFAEVAFWGGPWGCGSGVLGQAADKNPRPSRA